MYFSEIYSILFLDGFFQILYLFEKWEIFMPHPVSHNWGLKSNFLHIQILFNNLIFLSQNLIY